MNGTEAGTDSIDWSLKKFDGEGREEMNGGDKLIDEKRSQPLIGPY